MAKETRPSTRKNNQTASAISYISSGSSKTVRKSVTTTIDTISVPDRITSFIAKNAGSNDIVIRINASGTNYWTLRPNEISPKVAIANSTVIDFKSITGNSILECILEG